ncbi:MAG TPA: sigma-54 dependent transcriptional regulator [Thermoanaerobaculia bacterium]
MSASGVEAVVVRNRILVIEDEEAIRESVGDFFDAHGYSVDRAATCGEGERLFRTTRPDVVLCDFRLPDGDASRILETFRRIDTSVPLIVATGHGSIDLAVHMIKEGAADFVTKPLDLPTLRIIIDRHLDDRRRAARERASDLVRRRDETDPFIGVSDAIARVRDLAHAIAENDAAVLIGGDTGSGKGVLARWLHAHSGRAKEAFVDINCAGLSRELLESELFGHEKGAFTGATATKSGLFEIAHRGTAFLDEIGEIDLQVQPKLLKVIEDKRFRRVGDVQDRRVDIRLIAATHCDLASAVRQGRFRSDLFFRINTLTIVLPPLRARAEDIPLLAADLLHRMRLQVGKPRATLTPDAIAALRAYSWPGNIRELRNVIERALLLTARDEITRADLRFDFQDDAADEESGDMTLEAVERRHVRRMLDTEGGSVDRAARRLGIPRSTLYRRLKEWS